MGTAIALLVTVMLIPVIAKVIGELQIRLHNRHEEARHHDVAL